MRTEVILDDDVVALLTNEVERTQSPFEDVLNKALRAGLVIMAGAGDANVIAAEPLDGTS